MSIAPSEICWNTAAQMSEPSRDCSFCPRLTAFRLENRSRFPEWFNAPVPSFGSADASLLIVGLAPGLRGANRTGRPFTGDYAGVLLYETLLRFGLARGTYGGQPDDGLGAGSRTRCDAYRPKISRCRVRSRPAGAIWRQCCAKCLSFMPY
jgi:uracil-DNA glycosylase